MHGDKESNRSRIELLKAQLKSAGWLPSDLFVEPALRAPSGVYRPAIALTHNLYPLATLDLARTDAPAADGDGEFGDTTEPTFRVHLESDGASTWQRGAKEGHHWTPVPSPRNLWLLLGRDWNTADPRLQPSSSEQPRPRLHQVLAIGTVLDAVDAGRSYIQVLMPQGTGKTLVAQELVCKLLRSGSHRRVLWLTTHRAIAEQSYNRLQKVARDYDVALLPQQEPTDLAAIQVATTATFLQPSSSRLDSLPADLYDLILVTDLRQQSERWRKIAQHFPSARVIGFSDTPYYDPTFGEPAFQYTIDEALADEEIRAPDGFRVVRLGDITEISAGISAATNPFAGSVPIINARSLPSDGIWTTSPFQGEVHSEQQATPDQSVQSRPHWSSRHTLRPKDILISAILNPRQPRIAMVPPSVSVPLFIHNSVYRVRVTDPAIEPDAVLAFLRSDAGMRSIQRFASYLGGHLRVTARDLAQLPIFVPEAPSQPAGSAAITESEREATEQKLSAAGQALREMTETIIPELMALAGC